MADRKIFLASSGIQPETYPHFQKLSGKFPRDTKVGFITTADTNQNQTERAVDYLRTNGFPVVIIDISNCHPRFLRKALQRIDMFYVNGGNTFSLLHWMRKSKLHEPLQERLYEGMCYYGSSAGSLVAGPNIEMAGWDRSWDRNKIGMTDFRGLEIIDMAVFPHYDNKHKRIIAQKAIGVNYPIIAINNRQAVMVNGSQYTLAGEGEPVFFGQPYQKIENQQPLVAMSR